LASGSPITGRIHPPRVIKHIKSNEKQGVLEVFINIAIPYLYDGFERKSSYTDAINNAVQADLFKE